ncbi:MAG: cardiolipin synthase [Spirochaetia bacterium]|nr:cardiolipin synthase [Spirochaetia bacterium]
MMARSTLVITMSTGTLRVRPTILRAFILAVLIVAQIFLFIWMIWTTSKLSLIVDISLSILSLLVVLYIVEVDSVPSYSLIWSIVILLAPVFGGPFYLLFGLQSAPRKVRRRVAALDKEARLLLVQDGQMLESVASRREDFGRQARYLSMTAGFPVYDCSHARYLASGEEMFQALKAELAKAEHFIFLEFFIIDKGLMWDSILDILTQKVAQGVEVRVMYDDIGCLFTLPPDYDRVLEALGIRCTVFNRTRIVLTKLINNRDHRKIVVVDGKVAITGGVNLADEYINEVERFGHWKDAAVLIEGNAVRSLTMMFLNMWSLQTHHDEDYRKYMAPVSESNADFIQPYADNPIDHEAVSASVFLNIINSARRYVYITTPYLIVDHTIMTALCLAAKSGVEIRIITPRNWDKWLVHQTTRSYYDELVSAGVMVYEYTYGFMHAKTFVSDDETAVIGTTNLDYRSLYLHYECGVVLYGGPAVTALRDDFVETLSVCDQVTPGEYRPKTVFGRIFLQVLRLFAPLL